MLPRRLAPSTAGVAMAKPNDCWDAVLAPALEPGNREDVEAARRCADRSLVASPSLDPFEYAFPEEMGAVVCAVCAAVDILC